MKRAGMRRMLLLAVLLVLAVAVVVDLSGFPGGGGASGGPTSAGLMEAEISHEQRRMMIEDAERWEEALRIAEREWSATLAGLVRAGTIDVADGRFRERVLEEVRDLGIEQARVTAEKLPQPPADMPIKPIALRIEFNTTQVADAYKLIDRLEHMRDLRTNVAGVRLRGPGLPQEPREVDASITLHALALIGEEP